MTVSIVQLLLPTLRREGISWRTVGDRVVIEIELTNDTDEPTEGGDLVVEAAPLGAFVPFKPVARVTTSGLAPRERRRVTIGVPIDRLDRARVYRTLGTVEWAGNLNVYFDRAPERAVEVHRSFDLKVRAGRDVQFAFMLEPGPDYSIEARPSDPAWVAEVLHVRSMPMAFLTVRTPAQVALSATVEVLVTRQSDHKVVPVEFSMETTAGQGDTIGCVSV